MSEVSPAFSAIARKVRATLLRQFDLVKQTTVAERLEVSESTISRWKDDHLDRACQILAALDLQVLPASARVLERDKLQALFALAEKGLTELRSSMVDE